MWGCNELLALAILVKVSYAQLVFLTCTEMQGGGDMSECCNLKLKLIACSVPQRITSVQSYYSLASQDGGRIVVAMASYAHSILHYSVYMKCKSASHVHLASLVSRPSPSGVCMYCDIPEH